MRKSMAERILDGPLARTEEGTMCTAEEGKTRQSEAQQADINWTIKKYNLQPDKMLDEYGHPLIGWSGLPVGVFADLSEVPSFMEAKNRLLVAEEGFMRLPPEVRLRFSNDPAVMLDAWAQGQMAETFEEIGWLERRPGPAPEVIQKVQVVNPPVAGS